MTDLMNIDNASSMGDDLTMCIRCRGFYPEHEIYEYPVNYEAIEPEFHHHLPITKGGVTYNLLSVCEGCYDYDYSEFLECDGNERMMSEYSGVTSLLIWLDWMPRMNKRRARIEVADLERESRTGNKYKSKLFQANDW